MMDPIAYYDDRRAKALAAAPNPMNAFAGAVNAGIDGYQQGKEVKRSRDKERLAYVGQAMQQQLDRGNLSAAYDLSEQARPLANEIYGTAMVGTGDYKTEHAATAGSVRHGTDPKAWEAYEIAQRNLNAPPEGTTKEQWQGSINALRQAQPGIGEYITKPTASRTEYNAAALRADANLYAPAPKHDYYAADPTKNVWDQSSGRLVQQGVADPYDERRAQIQERTLQLRQEIAQARNEVDRQRLANELARLENIQQQFDFKQQQAAGKPPITAGEIERLAMEEAKRAGKRSRPVIGQDGRPAVDLMKGGIPITEDYWDQAAADAAYKSTKQRLQQEYGGGAQPAAVAPGGGRLDRILQGMEADRSRLGK